MCDIYFLSRIWYSVTVSTSDWSGMGSKNPREKQVHEALKQLFGEPTYDARTVPTVLSRRLGMPTVEIIAILRALQGQGKIGVQANGPGVDKLVVSPVDTRIHRNRKGGLYVSKPPTGVLAEPEPKQNGDLEQQLKESFRRGYDQAASEIRHKLDTERHKRKKAEADLVTEQQAANERQAALNRKIRDLQKQLDELRAADQVPDLLKRIAELETVPPELAARVAEALRS